MATVVFDGQTVEIAHDESLLEGLLRAGFKIPNSCRAGLCHACLMVGEASMPAAAREGLSQRQIEQQLFLACQCYVDTQVVVSLPDHSDDWRGHVVGHRLLNSRVLELRLEVDGNWQPGQHVMLWKDAQYGRAYSIASSRSRDGVIVLHIGLHTRGVVSHWCHDELSVGDAVRLSKPEGHCCYDSTEPDKTLLLVAAGTGLAPLYGVLHEALSHQHRGDIYLYAGARSIRDLYLVDELIATAAAYPNVRYCPVVDAQAAEGDAQAGAHLLSSLAVGSLAHSVKQNHPSMRGYKVFLAGAPEWVSELEKTCFFSGAGRADIVSDAFITGTAD